MTSLAEQRAWVALGNALLLDTLSRLDDDDLRADSLLPGWSRAHVLSHVANNATALGNLLTWARTGVEQAMYVSMEQRNADVESGALLAPDELRALVRARGERFEEQCDELTDDQWSTEVRNFQGRVLIADAVPWMRAREVLVHTVDLGADVGFDDLPTDFLFALVDEVVQQRHGAEGVPSLVIRSEGREWTVAGVGEATVVRGSLGDTATYLLGRGPAELVADGAAVPTMPRWF